MTSPRRRDAVADAHEVDPDSLRQTMGGFATGVAIVTTKTDGQPHGMTVNSLTSVSLRPPLILVCLTKDSRTASAVQRRGAFVVNLLNSRQEAWSNRFATPAENHFAETDFDVAELDLPVLPRSLGYLVCDVEDSYPGGDHVVVLGRVRNCESREGSPLIFFRGNYHGLTGPGRASPLPWFW